MKNIHTNAKRIHLVAGLLLTVIFIGSGTYLRSLFSEDVGKDIAQHMLFRANHIYILMAAIINLLMIANLKFPVVRWQYFLQRLASLAIILGSVTVVWAFIAEPANKTLERPLTLNAIAELTIGVLILLVANLKK